MASVTTVRDAPKPDLKLQGTRTSARLPARNGRWSGYRRLLEARMKELFREPVVVFWLVGFPVLMTVILGTAFRNKSPDVSHVVVSARSIADLTVPLLRASHRSWHISLEVKPEAEAQRDFRLGRYDLIITQQDNNSFQFQYDPTRLESVLANLVVQDAMQRSAGRPDTIQISTLSATQPGSRYIDFVVPGLLGMNLMSAGL